MSGRRSSLIRSKDIKRKALLNMASDVTVVIINYNTPDLTGRAVRSLRTYVPDIPLLIIDNGSEPGNRPELESLAALRPEKTTVIFNADNLHHGPAMDQALHVLTTPYVLFLDSDCEVLTGGWIERMAAMADASSGIYAVGKKIFMDDRGFDIADRPGAHPYIRPICMLVRREAYLRYPPFERHGAPCLRNFIAAHAAGEELVHCPVEDFVYHAGRGTASRHGYALGLRGKINQLLHMFGL